MRLYATNEAVTTFNLARLQLLGQPIARIDAVHNRAAAARFDASEAGGLSRSLFLQGDADIVPLVRSRSCQWGSR